MRNFFRSASGLLRAVVAVCAGDYADVGTVVQPATKAEGPMTRGWISGQGRTGAVSVEECVDIRFVGPAE